MYCTLFCIMIFFVCPLRSCCRNTHCPQSTLQARTDGMSKTSHRQTQTSRARTRARARAKAGVTSGEGGGARKGRVERRNETKQNETSSHNHFIIPILDPNQPLGLAFIIDIFFALQLFIISPLPRT
jgi:hypothetical protein